MARVTGLELHLFLPQMRMTIDTMVERARAAEAAGFTGIALMDHLAPPQALDQPMHEAMVTATWLAAHTTTLKVGHLVLCDALRHPAVLARQAVSIDHASNGRFELGIGSGSVPEELDTFGVTDLDAKQRVARLGETLDVVRALWSGEPVDHDGAYHDIIGGQQRPTPLGTIPIVIGGIGPRTLELVAAHADWWNVPLTGLHRIDDLRGRIGRARVSVQQMVTVVPSEAERDDVMATVNRRFPWLAGSPDAHIHGTVGELVDRFAALRARGIERAYCWFTDFASPESLATFGDVITS
jgi:alkanesulfonate monooxygenase SsuD/methylene tetrahydromethanopterin reductase-like flavin-dependent oxidoreductase (luciferase family)